MSHTKEPWGLMNDGPDPKRDLLTPWQAYGETDAGGLTIASPHNTEPICRVSGCCQPVAGNAQRIVLCVNALAGVPDEALRKVVSPKDDFNRLCMLRDAIQVCIQELSDAETRALEERLKKSKENQDG